MGMLIDSNVLKGQFQKFFDMLDARPIMIHTDIGRIGIPDRVRPRTEMLKVFEELILEASTGKTLLFPTFNYDYCKKGLYSVGESLCQVGVLNEHFRRQSYAKRTETPVFNFSIVNETGGYTFRPKENPFGGESTFAEHLASNGCVAFIGAPFHSNTFLHFVEESLPVGYRYLKPFAGKIVHDNLSSDFELHYRVRPFVDGAAEYDWKRLTDELASEGILNYLPLGNSKVMYYHARELFEYWNAKIGSDEFYLLTERGRSVANQLYAKFGKPLSYERMERKE